MKSVRSTTIMRVTLTAAQRRFVEKRVRESGYRSANEYFQVLVRRAQHEPRGPSFSSRSELKHLILEGLRSPATPWTAKDEKELRARIRRRARARKR
jgi:Arc/MetJ-type ribon-helix-helix transcriptional regulator